MTQPDPFCASQYTVATLAKAIKSWYCPQNESGELLATCKTPFWIKSVGCLSLPNSWFLEATTTISATTATIIRVIIPPGARVRPPTNYWASYQPTIGYLTNQLLGILPTNLQHSFYQFFPPLATHAFNDSGSSTTFLSSMFPPLGNPCLALGFRF